MNRNALIVLGLATKYKGFTLSDAARSTAGAWPGTAPWRMIL